MQIYVFILLSAVLVCNYAIIQICKQISMQVCKIPSSEPCKYAYDTCYMKLFFMTLAMITYSLTCNIKLAIYCKKIATFRDCSVTRNFYNKSDLF